MAYNTEHGLKPRPINKEIAQNALTSLSRPSAPEPYDTATPDIPQAAEPAAVYGNSEQAVPIELRIEDLRGRMKAAAAKFDFILAAQLRDEMLALEKQIKS